MQLGIVEPKTSITVYDIGVSEMNTAKPQTSTLSVTTDYTTSARV